MEANGYADFYSPWRNEEIIIFSFSNKIVEDIKSIALLRFNLVHDCLGQ